jgi:hypothetical protein
MARQRLDQLACFVHVILLHQPGYDEQGRFLRDSDFIQATLEALL